MLPDMLAVLGTAHFCRFAYLSQNALQTTSAFTHRLPITFMNLSESPCWEHVDCPTLVFMHWFVIGFFWTGKHLMRALKIPKWDFTGKGCTFSCLLKHSVPNFLKYELQYFFRVSSSEFYSSPFKNRIEKLSLILKNMSSGYLYC